MTTNDLINHIMTRVAMAGGEEQTGLLKPLVISQITPALRALSEYAWKEKGIVANGSFAVNCASGLIQTASLPIIHSSIPFATTLTLNNMPCFPAWDLTHLNSLPTPTLFPYYTAEGLNIRVRNTDGTLNTLNASGTLIAPKSFQTVEDVPQQLEDELIETLWNLVKGVAAK